MAAADEDRCRERVANLVDAVMEEARVRFASASMRCWAKSEAIRPRREVGDEYLYDGSGGGVDVLSCYLRIETGIYVCMCQKGAC